MQVQSNLISTYRTELMGIATLSVFLAHILHRYHSNPFGDVIPALFLYTYGFFFLSGYGISFSLKKSSQIVQFYKKRLHRVVFPYLCVSVIPIALITLLNHDGIIEYIQRILTIGYWIEGNVCGTWYVSVILLFYLIVPLLYYNARYVTGITLFSFFALYGYSLLAGNNYAYSALQASFFYIGILYANGYKAKWITFPLISIFFLSFMLVHKCWFLESVLAIIAIFIWAKFISFCSKVRSVIFVLNWFGKNSLLLYLLHLQFCIVLEKFCVKGKLAILIAIVTALLVCMLKDNIKRELRQKYYKACPQDIL